MTRPQLFSGQVSGQASDPSGQAGESSLRSQDSKPSSAYTKEQYLRHCSRSDRTWEQAIAHPSALASDQTSDQSIDSVIIQPQFYPNQTVYFIGGCGIVKNCQPYARTWAYAVEMELGPEPEMGRIGSEATILLIEAEIRSSADGFLATPSR